MEILSEILHHILYLQVYFAVLFLCTVFQVPILFFSYVLNVYMDFLNIFNVEVIFEENYFLSVWFLIKLFLLRCLSLSLECQGVFFNKFNIIIVIHYLPSSSLSSLIVSSFLWILNLLLKYNLYNLQFQGRGGRQVLCHCYNH